MQGSEMRLIIVVLATALVGLAACGNGGVSKNNEDDRPGVPCLGADCPGPAPETQFSTSELVFAELEVGETESQGVTIQNLGPGNLNIGSIQLVEDTTDDSGDEFAKGADWVNSVVLKTDEQFHVNVDYTPGDLSADTGYVALVTNDPQFEAGVLRIPIRTIAPEPRIETGGPVVFQSVPPVDETTRDTFWQLLEVRNVGEAVLNLEDIRVEPQEPFSVSYPASSDPEANPANDSDSYAENLDPGDSLAVRVYFNPEDQESHEASLVIESDDPEQPAHTVSLLGNVPTPCIQLSEEGEIDFGESGVGFANDYSISIENCSARSDLVVRSIEVCTVVDGTCDPENPLFQLETDTLPGSLGSGGEAIIYPGEAASFVLTFVPEDFSVSNGELTVRSDDPARPEIVIPVTGKGTDNACPQAIAEAKLSDGTMWGTEINTTPLQTIDFRATNSVDPDGSIATYEWSLLQKPANSTARFTPSAAVEEPTLFLDLAGEYLVELRVFDDRGEESCGDQALVTINATSDADISVQVVWDTPTDSDQTDAVGTDIDLHFLHPNGTWNELPYDIFWNNPTADWGVPGPDDDPSLDIDDTDGAGPEVINLTQPESGLTYAVGVYYYASNGLGPSYATVRIFVGGQLAEEFMEQYLASDRAFWYAATISWPSGAIYAVNQISQGFPSRP